jgi:hypothetical protein
MPTTTPEEEVLVAEWRQSLTDLETAITTKVTRTLSQRFATGPGGSRFSSSAVIEPAGHQRTVLLADEAPVRQWLGQPRSFRSSVAFEAKIERRAATISGVSPTLYQPGIRGPQQPGLRLDEILPRITALGGGGIEWTRETSFVPGADIVPETTLKPSTALTFANVMTPFSTIATITKASVQALADVPMLQQWINARLMYAVQLREENYLLNDPVAGMLVAAQALDAAFMPVAPATQLDMVGAAIGQLESAGYVVDGVVLAGVDVNKARLVKSTTGEYIWASPDSSIGTAAMWSVPVVISPSMAPGQFLVGAFGQSTLLFDRDILRIDLSFENEDDFVRNMCTIRAEARMALAIPVPVGLVKGAFTGSTSTMKAPPAPHSK